MMPLYDHAFSLEFSIQSGFQCDNPKDMKSRGFFEWPSPHVFRKALLTKIASLDDTELLDAIGMPFDTLELNSDDNFNE